jgi:hypothetical protein
MEAGEAPAAKRMKSIAASSNQIPKRGKGGQDAASSATVSRRSGKGKSSQETRRAPPDSRDGEEDEQSSDSTLSEDEGRGARRESSRKQLGILPVRNAGLEIHFVR